MKNGLGQFKKIKFNLILTFLILCLSVVLSLNNSLDFLNWKIYDALVKIHRKEPVKQKDIVIVNIDQSSIDTVSKNLKHYWPWPRDFYAQITSFLTFCGAKAIIFDIIFSEPDTDRIQANGADCDNSFGEAIKESGITYLTAVLREAVSQNPLDNKIFIQTTPDLIKLKKKSYSAAGFPIPVLLKGARGVCFANSEPESDNIIRRYSLVFKYRDGFVSSTAYEIARNVLPKETVDKNINSFFGRNTKIDNEGKILINWYGKGGPDGVFVNYSFHAVLISSTQVETGEKPLISPECFKEKIVFVGSSAEGLLDLKTTPFTSIKEYPGVEVHATALANIINNDMMYSLPFWILLVSMFLVSILLFIFNNIYKNLKTFIVLFFGLLIFEILLSYILIANNLWMPGADLIINTALVFTGLVISGYFSETKDKRLLRKQFERYVNDNVLEEILANPLSVDVKGRAVNATILATDIADFTTISESMSSREVVSRLNNYLSETSEALIEHGAFINKYIGDAILAVFGAFEEGNHRKNACLGALRALSIINLKIEEAKEKGEMPLYTRFGITTGEVTLGNIGSERKTEYTVIGDAVNSAFRLEGLNKYYGTTMLVSEYTREGNENEFEFRWVDTLRYKGKIIPVNVYELLGLKGEVKENIITKRDKYESALHLYMERKFTEALIIFSILGQEGDKASEIFIGRCENFIQKPPEPEWDGVWVMMRK